MSADVVTVYLLAIILYHGELYERMCSSFYPKEFPTFETVMLSKMMISGFFKS